VLTSDAFAAVEAAKFTVPVADFVPLAIVPIGISQSFVISK